MRRQRSSVERRAPRRARIRARIRGTADRPRLSVFRSARHLTVQLIDDVTGRTLLAVGEAHLPREGKASPRGRTAATALGSLLAARASAQGITAVVFDRGGYAYAGKIKTLAESARAGGLRF